MKKITILVLLLMSTSRLLAQVHQYGALDTDNTWTGINTFTQSPIVPGVGLADPGANGVMTRTALNVTAPATATEMSSPDGCVDSSGTDAYACNLSPVITSYAASTVYRFKAGTNNTGAATVNFNGKGALPIVKMSGGITTALADNDIRAGQWVSGTYDGTNFQMGSQLGNVAASGGVTGGSCTNQVVTANNTQAVPTCITVTSNYVDSSISNVTNTPQLSANSGIPFYGSGSPGTTTTLNPVHSAGNTGAISTATLCAATATNCNNAGDYTVEWVFTQTGTACATPGPGGVTFLLTWTDSNATAHSAVSLAMDDSASLTAKSGTFTFRTTHAAAWASGSFHISSNGSIIQYATGYTACTTGTGSYALDIFVTRKR